MPRPDWDWLSRREQACWRQGLTVAGVDEVGRGPLAGPVVAAAVVLPPQSRWDGLDDSKKLSLQAREAWYRALRRAGAAIGVGAATAAEIDAVNILRATELAMTRALANLPQSPDWVLVDAVPLECGQPVEALVHGDARSASIAAASVVAKVLRDRYMTWLDRQWPQYGFARHKGYPTPGHWEALARFGPTPAHRRSFLRRAQREQWA